MILSFGSARGVCLSNGVVVLAMLFVESGIAEEKSQSASPASAINGQVLFAREWIPGDKRSHGGDGLGPMFNDSSCVACHNLGGIGGGGPSSKNVDIVTAFKNNQQHAGNARPPATLPEAFVRSLFGTLDAPREVPNPENAAKESAEDRAAQQKVRLEKAKAQQDAERQELGKLHPGFLAGPSIVLHQNATYTGYDAWRARMAGLHFGGVMSNTASELKFFSPQDAASSTAEQSRLGLRPDSTRSAGTTGGTQGQLTLQQLHNEVQFAQHAALNSSTQHGNFAIIRSQRNTTALFGAGKIDAIPVAFLQELERQQAEKKTEISGRVARLKDGSAGRFGWKAQTPTLRDFVLTACAVELGLNVPGHAQAGVPQKPDYAAPGLDLNAAECDALIRYVNDLPAPTQRDLSDPTDAAYVLAGHKLFDSVGCAACHVADVGEAQGIFSDLLVHDMGPELGDTGSYGVFVPDSTPEGQAAPISDFADSQRSSEPQAGAGAGPVIGATRQEWRTPPLWGVRDSAPYLHDGRARTLEQTIALHGGESAKSAQSFFALSPAERFQVVTFLKSLVAPDQVASAQ